MFISWAHPPCLWQADAGLQRGGLVEWPEAGYLVAPFEVMARFGVAFCMGVREGYALH
jgi:hypothetical protein